MMYSTVPKPRSPRRKAVTPQQKQPSQQKQGPVGSQQHGKAQWSLYRDQLVLLATLMGLWIVFMASAAFRFPTQPPDHVSSLLLLRQSFGAEDAPKSHHHNKHNNNHDINTTHNNNNSNNDHKHDNTLTAADLAQLHHAYQHKLRLGEFVDYTQPAIPTRDTLPPPKIHSQPQQTQQQHKMVVLCMSARDHFEARQAIRDTWANNNSHLVLFVVGGPSPPWNRTIVPRHHHVRLMFHHQQQLQQQLQLQQQQQQKQNKPQTVAEQIQDTVATAASLPLELVVEDPTVQSRLQQEAQQYQDILDVIHPDRYSSLPYKLMYGFQWITQNIPDVDWIVKTDDDMVARLDTLQKVLLQVYNPQQPLVLGHLKLNHAVPRSGRWTEYLYPQHTYPVYPQGSFGYIVSAPVARYVASLPETLGAHFNYYQGEDVSLGIWIHQNRIFRQQVRWLFSYYLHNGKNCSQHQWLIVGHYLTPQQIRNCHFAAAMTEKTNHETTRTTTTTVPHHHNTMTQMATSGTTAIHAPQSKLDARGEWTSDAVTDLYGARYWFSATRSQLDHFRKQVVRQAIQQANSV